MEQIRFVLERFFYGWKMNALVFDKEDRIVDFCIGTVDMQGGDSAETRKKIQEKLIEESEYAIRLYRSIKSECMERKIPIVKMEEDGIYYVAFADAKGHLYLFGPVSAEKLSFAQQIAYRKRHNVPSQKYLVPKVSLAKALNGVSLVYYMLTGNQVTEQEILERSGISDEVQVKPEEIMQYEIQNTTEEKQHLAYQDEMRWITAIENGTLQPRETRMTQENIGKVEQIGTLAKSDSIKQFEYMAVTSCCLASRAAIRGGVNAYEAYRTSEMFLQKISVCSNVMEILQIHMEISNTFSQMVREAKELHGFGCVEQCKDYIARHRTKRFSLQDVAQAVGKNPSYLSRIFSEQTGETMQEYALNLRLEAAANILQYSNESVGNIAEYLDFPSQSYFGERFRRKYGVTPAEYRKNHKIRDFKE